MRLQEIVYNALISLELPVVKYVHEYSGEYPLIVYQEISNVPETHADNQELTRRVIFQISIGTDDDNSADIEKSVEKLMYELGFMRVDTQDIFNDVYWRVIRFVILEVKENE